MFYSRIDSQINDLWIMYCSTEFWLYERQALIFCCMVRAQHVVSARKQLFELKFGLVV